MKPLSTHLFNLQRDGTSQHTRLLPALQPDYFRVDELSFADLMAMALDYAGLIRYTNLNNQAEGDWRGFFQSDEAFILSAILATHLDLFEKSFAQYLAGQLGAHPVLHMVQQLDEWLGCVHRLNSVAALRIGDRLSSVIEHSLAQKFAELCLFLAQKKQPVVLNVSAVWQFPKDVNEDEEAPLLDVPDTAADETEQRAFLKANFNAFYNAILLLQSSAEEILQVSLQRPTHDPALAVYIAFLRLFAKAQDKINDFSQRHLHFYYHDVLKTQLRAVDPGSAYLVFQTDKVGREVLINKGCEFKAGMDEQQQERIFIADNDLAVSDAKVTELLTLFLARNPLSFPENALHSTGSSQQFVTAAKLNRIWATDEMPLSVAPLFGDSRREQYPAARLGLAVASKTLLLQQGQRTISVVLKLQDDILERFVIDLSQQLNTSYADAFFKAFRQMFQIALTGEHGWLQVAEYLPLCHQVNEICPENGLLLQITLPDEMGAVVPYLNKLHGEDFDTDLPMIKLCLNPDAYLYAYSLLSDAVLREIEISVNVTGCTDVVLHNQLGQLSASAQFNPFGPLPVVGDYLIVGCYEAACKNLSDFSVSVSWGGLPPQGLITHYRGYAQDYRPEVFKANLSVLKDRKWLPQTPLVANLFTSERHVSVAQSTLSFQSLCGLTRPVEHIRAEQFKYDHSVKDGFFRLELSHPHYAFGHKDYPLVLSKVLTDNAAMKRFKFAKLFGKKFPQKPVPNPAYTPLMNAITVNYQAVTHIPLAAVNSRENSGQQDAVFHLHPCGAARLSPKGLRKITCLPQFEQDGNLYIGLTASQLQGVITLFFHLREDSKPSAAGDEFLFHWYYLASNEWKRLDASHLLSDSTHGFLCSGIVTLDIPEDINRDNSILPNHCFWLKVASHSGQLHSLCSLYGVYSHALKVTWQPQTGSVFPQQQLPAGSIKEPKRSIVGVSEIKQISDGFGYLPPETEAQQIVRMSERLKHKNRAIMVADYERLVLQKFPEIHKVKCFPCMDGKTVEGRGERVRPGHILLVLIPHPNQSEPNSHSMVNALLLSEVKQYVASLASASVTVHVRNPIYEQIQVRCKVKLHSGKRSGHYYNLLNQEICQYLSPWSGGLGAKFGWSLRCEDIQAHIQRLEFVAAVAGVSLLKIRESDASQYALGDTARGYTSRVKYSYPWSIAIPVAQHLIEFHDENRAWQAEQTGIAKLAIGSTFILSRENP